MITLHGIHLRTVKFVCVEQSKVPYLNNCFHVTSDIVYYFSITTKVIPGWFWTRLGWNRMHPFVDRNWKKVRKCFVALFPFLIKVVALLV